MPIYTVVDDPDNPPPMQHPGITLVDADGGPYNPATSIPDGTYVPTVEASTSIGRSEVIDNARPLVTFSTPWGIRADGVGYYDPAGAASGEEAALVALPDPPAPIAIGTFASPKTPGVAMIAADINEVGVTVGGVSVVNSLPRVTYTTPWGIRTSDGLGYYDAAGAAPGDEAALGIDTTGRPVLTKIRS